MADTEVVLRWEGEGLQFRGGVPGGPEVPVDGDGRTAPSPTRQLLLALAGCMGADLVDIMARSRAPLGSLEVRVTGGRAPEPPRRFTSIHLQIIAGGVAAADAPKLERALELSRKTYCSVLHTLRSDIELTFALERG